jgi:hypothetical protein
MTSGKRPEGAINFKKFYTEAQLANFPDGTYEVTASRDEIDVRGTTVTQRTTFLVRPVKEAADD